MIKIMMTFLVTMTALFNIANAEVFGTSSPEYLIKKYSSAAFTAFRAGNSEESNYNATNGLYYCGRQQQKTQPECDMLSLIPIFHSVNEQTAQLVDLKKAIYSARPGEAELTKANDILNSYKASFEQILEKREQWVESNAMPTDFVQMVDSNLGVLVCNQLDKVLLAQFGAFNDRDLYFSKKDEVSEMKCQMSQVGVSSKEASCAVCK